MAFKYSGILARPYKLPPPPGLMADNATRAAFEQWHRASQRERWQALFEAHGVEFGDVPELLLRMAVAHVPGFRAKHRDGPKQVWDMDTKARLRIAVDDFVAQRKAAGKPASISQACKYLAIHEPWASMLRRGNNSPSQALREHYNTADKRWVKVVRDADAYEALFPDAMAPWDRAVEKVCGEPARNLRTGKSRSKKST